MLTKKAQNRILFIFFILKALNQNILYFSTPTEIKTGENITIGKAMRVGGMVKKDSILINKKNIQFIVTDFQNEILINYSGTVPNLFAEGKGVVAEGKLKDKNFFAAERILAKHDEKYMPPEIKSILEKNAK
jgi:cytochrome c-type biogenesis protein CcmE